MPPQSAMNGQSLPQSGREGLPGQHGISSGADGAIEAAAIGSPMDACIVGGTAIAGSTIGASARLPIAKKAKKYPRIDRPFIASRYYSLIVLNRHLIAQLSQVADRLFSLVGLGFAPCQGHPMSLYGPFRPSRRCNIMSEIEG